MTKKIFLTLVLIIIAGIGLFWLYRERIFSKDILRVEVLGPRNAKTGDEVEYTVKYKNNGNFVLENPRLIFNLPDNSLTEDSKVRFVENLKDIYPGQEDSIKFKGTLIGKEGDVKVADVVLSYTPKNLSARYESQTSLATTIDTVPITLDFDMPTKIEKNKDFTYVVNYFSNIDYPLENLSIKIDPVQGFNFTSSDPLSLDDVEWKLDTLQKAHGGRLKIKGSLNADMQTKVTFVAKLGMWQDGTFIEIKQATKEVEIIQPLIFMSQRINGSSSYVASPGETLRYELFFRNIGSSPFNDLFIISRLSGDAFDMATLHTTEGEVRPADNLVAFDAKQMSSLKRLDQNQEVKVAFDVKLKDSWTPTSSKNATVVKNTMEVVNISQEFTTKVNSKLELTQQVSPTEGVYQITWQVKNYFNDVKNVKVKAVLPPKVSLNDFMSPEAEASHFSFDNQSREIVWSVGDLSAGSGVENTPISVAFRVSGAAALPNLINQATVSGEDQFTGAIVTAVVTGL